MSVVCVPGSFYLLKKMILVRICSDDVDNPTVSVEVWNASTVTNLCVGPAATRTEGRVLAWSSDSHYFEEGSGLSVIDRHQLLVLVDTDQPTFFRRRWEVKLSEAGILSILRVCGYRCLVSPPSLERGCPSDPGEADTHSESCSQFNVDDMEDSGAGVEDVDFDEMPKTFLLPDNYVDETGAAIQVTNATWGLCIGQSSIKALGIFNTDDNYRGPLRIFPLLGRIVAAGPGGAYSRRMSLHDRQRAYALPDTVCKVYLPSCPHGSHPPSTSPAPFNPRGKFDPGAHFCRCPRGRQ